MPTTTRTVPLPPPRRRSRLRTGLLAGLAVTLVLLTLALLAADPVIGRLSRGRAEEQLRARLSGDPRDVSVSVGPWPVLPRLLLGGRDAVRTEVSFTVGFDELLARAELGSGRDLTFSRSGDLLAVHVEGAGVPLDVLVGVGVSGPDLVLTPTAVELLGARVPVSSARRLPAEGSAASDLLEPRRVPVAAGSDARLAGATVTDDGLRLTLIPAGTFG